MTVRSKFKCFSITDYGQSVQVSMQAVYSTTGENKDFCEATPSGELKISITKDRPAAGMFEVGKSYYLDFTQADVVPAQVVEFIAEPKSKDAIAAETVEPGKDAAHTDADGAEPIPSAQKA